MMTAEEIRQMVQTRDLLNAKLRVNPPPLADNLWLKKAYDGVMLVLKHTGVDVEER